MTQPQVVRCIDGTHIPMTQPKVEKCIDGTHIHMTRPQEVEECIEWTPYTYDTTTSSKVY